MASMSSRMIAANSRFFAKKYTSLVPSATITAVGRKPSFVSFLYVFAPEYVVEMMPPIRRDHQPSTTTVSKVPVSARRRSALAK